jgi:hypothetical protein
MRALAAATACALLLGGCAAGAPATPEKAAKNAPVGGYNRRELPTAQGLFTGKDGVWTIYRNDAERAAEAPPAPPAPRETLLCQRGQQCDPPPDE